MDNKNEVLVSDPVSLATGKLTNFDLDFALPGLIPIVVARSYRQGLDIVGGFGRSRMSEFDITIRKDNESDDLVYMNPAGLRAHFFRPTPSPGLWERNSVHPELALAAGRKRSLILKEGGLFRHFAKYDDKVWRPIRIEDRNGNAALLERSPEGILLKISLPEGPALLFDNDAQGLRSSIALVGREGGERRIAGYSYDEHGNLLSADVAYGTSQTYRYDRAGRLVAWSDSFGTQAIHEYDDENRVICTRTNGPYDGDRFEYDVEARTTRYFPSGREGLVRTYIFDAQKRLIEEYGAGGERLEREYEGHQLALLRDALGHETHYAYDDSGNLTSLTDAEGRQQNYTWNEDGKPVLAFNTLGHVESYSYDANYNLVQYVDAEGYGSEIANNQAGQPARIMRSDGLMESRSYDDRHWLIALRNFRGEVTRYERDEFGRIIAVTDPAGGVTRLRYEDRKGGDFWSVSILVRADGATASRLVEGGGRVLATSDGEGRRTLSRYGPFGLLYGQEDAKGGQLHFQYDHARRIVEVRNQKNLVWQFERNAAGHVVEECDFDGMRLAYAYDAAGRLIETRHQDGARLTYDYDKSGLLTREAMYEPKSVQPDDVTSYRYDAAGRLVQAENNHAGVTYDRDKLGRVLTETINGRRVDNNYNCCGLRVRRGIGAQVVETLYEPLGAVKQIAIGDHAPLSFERDVLGHELRRVSPAGFQLDQRYDLIGQLITQSAGLSSSSGDAGGPGRASPREVQAGVGGRPIERHYAWNRALAPVAIRDKGWGELGYDYDDNGQILQTRFGDGEGERFGYDPALNLDGFGDGLDRTGEGFGLTPSVAGSGYLGAQDSGGIQGWVLSDGGRVKLATGPHGERIELEHDQRGRVTLRKVERKGFRPKIWRYQWDAKDRLTRCITPDQEAWHYGYDPFGRRIWKVKELTLAEARLHVGRFPGLIDQSRLLPDYASQLLPLPTQHRGRLPGQETEDDKDKPPVVGIAYGWDGDMIAEEAPLRLDGTIEWEKATRWYFEPNGFRPLAKETTDGELHYIVTDHLGTPREMFDENGKLRWAAEYRTWGEVRRLWLSDAANDNGTINKRTASIYPRPHRPQEKKKGISDGADDHSSHDVDSTFTTGGLTYGNLSLKDIPNAIKARFLCPIRFQGQWEDEENGLYYNRFRYYDPLTGRYLSDDPTRAAGGLNPSAYALFPTTWIDPSGLTGVYLFETMNGTCYAGKGPDSRFEQSQIQRTGDDGSRNPANQGSQTKKDHASSCCAFKKHWDLIPIATNIPGVTADTFAKMVENQIIALTGANLSGNSWANEKLDGQKVFGANPGAQSAATAEARSILAEFRRKNPGTKC